jgi:NAD(P)-dependent dehydrogenase (short-subunit alcohol dehydrogenase family)
MNANKLENKVGIITGGASGIGLATAKRFLEEGARVVLADRDEKQGHEALQKLGGDENRIRLSVCDVSKEKDVHNTVADTIAWFSGLDVIVNNAGLMIFKGLEDHSLEDWTKVLSVDLLGAFFFIREAFKNMKNGGAIVNVSSIHAVETTPNVAAYAAAKAALVSLTHSAAIEGKSKRIRVNAVLPGAIDTPMLWENPNIKAGLEVINKTDVGKPEDVASLIAYLASSDSCFIQGASVLVDGGRLSRL